MFAENPKQKKKNKIKQTIYNNKAKVSQLIDVFSIYKTGDEYFAVSLYTFLLNLKRHFLFNFLHLSHFHIGEGYFKITNVLWH